jgi:asparagine synthase (glutamine-hydrolysing)
MCGLAGLLVPGGARADELESEARRMAAALRHRGPDDDGVWVDAAAGVGLGHQRLAVVDLSEQGHQPMVSADGRLVIIYNGEIYNHPELRRELAGRGHRFRGHSDTEVMLAAFTEWSFEAALPRLNGMFAFALWDRETRVLRLARDRLGEKPLYHGWVGGRFVFGSELKALAAGGRLAGVEIDRQALALYFRHDCIPAPRSIYRGVSKLPPGCWLAVRADGGGAGIANDPGPVAYWSAREAGARGAAHPLSGKPDEIVERLDVLLRDAIKIRMQADVPLGACLSGGIDSSTVVALMQAQSDRPIKTYTIGFREAVADEAEHARAVARYLGTEHTERVLTPEDCLAVIPRLPTLYDEPFGDSSQIPTYLVSELARRHVTVSLSGDGGDELFAGYHRHFWRLWERIGWIPAGARRGAKRALARVAELAPAGARRKLEKLARVVDAGSPEDMYLEMITRWKPGAGPLVLGAEAPPAHVDVPVPDFARPTHRMMYLDLVGYLPDDILVKVDRASMGVSLEARVPYLDHRVVELAWRIPLEVNLLHPRGKWPLRRILSRHVPQPLVDRPKHGFSLPLAGWLRGPLRDWAEALLDERRLTSEGFLDPAPVRRAWQRHLRGGAELHHDIWDVLMFEAWLEATRSPGTRG